MRRRFFVERFDGRRAFLPADAAHHLARVLRAEAGQLYELSDGQAVWLARIERVGRDAVEFALVEQVPARAPDLRVTLLLAIVKYDRFEWSLEKATELGVAEIVPLAAARSEKALISAATKRAARWQKILVEAAQQARRLRPPVLRLALHPREAFSSVCPMNAPATHESGGSVPASKQVRIVLSERHDALSLREVLEGKQARHAVVAVGPEGGWCDTEISDARAEGFVEGSLGTHILRTETAVVAALACLNYALGA